MIGAIHGAEPMSVVNIQHSVLSGIVGPSNIGMRVYCVLPRSLTQTYLLYASQ